MGKYCAVFPGKHTFLAVVHVEDIPQALRNVNIAKENGADGVFLINHDSDYEALLECYDVIIGEVPDFWIGLNCLDLGSRAIAVIPHTCAGLWVDSAGIEEEGSRISTTKATYFQNRRSKNSGWKGLYFGGVAFKGQSHLVNVAEVTKQAIPFVDVITTSGVRTGSVSYTHLRAHETM
jgi:hypothetical protein